MEDKQQKAKVLEDYYKWHKSNTTKKYWAKRDQKHQLDQNDDGSARNNSSGASSSSCSSSVTAAKSVQTISLAEAKELMVPNITIFNNSSRNQNYIQSLSKFKHDIFESLDTYLLSFEAHLQHVLALSNILFIRKHSYHPHLEVYFTGLISNIHQSLMILLVTIVLHFVDKVLKSNGFA